MSDPFFDIRNAETVEPERAVYLLGHLLILLANSNRSLHLFSELDLGQQAALMQVIELLREHHPLHLPPDVLERVLSRVSQVLCAIDDEQAHRLLHVLTADEMAILQSATLSMWKWKVTRWN